MRLVCIDDRCILEASVIPLVKGDIYNAVDVGEVKNHRTSGGNAAVNGTYYKLIETGFWYHHSLFIPINENQQDENEMASEREKQLTNGI